MGPTWDLQSLVHANNCGLHGARFLVLSHKCALTQAPLSQHLLRKGPTPLDLAKKLDPHGTKSLVLAHKYAQHGPTPLHLLRNRPTSLPLLRNDPYLGPGSLALLINIPIHVPTPPALAQK